MGIEAISELVAVVLSISLATERLVLVIRTPQKFLWIIPLGQWLNIENKVHPEQDGPRRLVVQMISFLCALFTVGWFAAGDGIHWLPLRLHHKRCLYGFWLFLPLAARVFGKTYLDILKRFATFE
jgi:hypothetical protein